MSVLVLHRALLPRTTHSLPRVKFNVRHMHPSTIALKKKRHALSSPQSFLEDSEDELSFDEAPAEDELFSSRPHSSSSTGSLHVVKQREFLGERAELFSALYASALNILRKPGKMRQPPRSSTVVRLAALAETREDLEKVMEVAAAWRSAGLLCDPQTCDEFLGRCMRLNHPEIALQVLKDRPKYGMDLPSLATARRLLHKFALPRKDNTSHALVDSLTFAELYPLHGLPPAPTDVISCATLAAVMARHFPKDQAPTEQPEGAQVMVTSEPWSEIIAEFEKTVNSQEGTIREMSPRTLQWLRGNIRDIRLTMQRTSGGTEPWLRRLKWEIRPQDTRDETVPDISAGWT